MTVAQPAPLPPPPTPDVPFWKTKTAGAILTVIAIVVAALNETTSLVPAGRPHELVHLVALVLAALGYGGAEWKSSAKDAAP